MDKKKSLIGAGALTALATIALVSCGGGKTKTYTITLDVNDSAATLNSDTETYTVKTASELVEALANVKPTKTGYTFVGWYLDADATVKLTADTDLKSLTAEDDGAIYIYAAFEVADFTVTFDLKGNATTAAVADKSTESVKYNGSVTAAPTITTPAKDSGSHEMTFTGWYTSAADAASGDTTKAVTPSSVKITGNTTFYAGWTITKIDTEAAFLEYINAKSQTVNAYIANDITLTAAIQRTAAAASANENLSTNGTDQTNSMSAKLYGDNHTITGLSINSDLKSSGLWGKFSGTIQDINFASVTATTTGQNAAVLVGTVEDGATFTDISFDGVEFTNNASNGYAAIVAAQVKDAQVNATFDGVTIKGLDMECTKYSAAILATVVGANATINFTDCLVQGEIVGTGESVGLVFGFANKDKSTGSTLTFDGVVAAGSITAAKNVGAIVGNNKDTTTTVVIKNSAVLDYSVSTNDGTATQLNTFVGQNAGTLTLDTATCYYQENKCTLILKGENSNDTEIQGTPVTLEALATKTLSSNIAFTYDAATSKLTTTIGSTSIDVTDPAVIDTTNYVTTFNSDLTSGGILTLDTNGVTNKVIGMTNYYEGVIAGKAGYGVKVTINVPTLNDTAITDLVGTYVAGGDLTNVTINNGVITGYLILSAEDVATLKGTGSDGTNVDKTATVVWFKNNVEVATPITYKFTFIGTATSGSIKFPTGTRQIGSATLSTVDASHNKTTPLTASAVSDTTLNITAGQIDYEKGNFVYVDVAVPQEIKNGSHLVDTTTIKTSSNASLVDFNTDTKVATVKVSVAAKGDTKYTVQWNANWYDADNYVINVADDVVIQANQSAGAVQIVYNASTQTVTTSNTGAGSAFYDGEKVSITTGKSYQINALNSGKSFTADSNTFTQVFLPSGNTNSAANGYKVTAKADCTVVIYYVFGDGTSWQDGASKTDAEITVSDATVKSATSVAPTASTVGKLVLDLTAGKSVDVYTNNRRMIILAVGLQ